MKKSNINRAEIEAIAANIDLIADQLINNEVSTDTELTEHICSQIDIPESVNDVSFSEIVRAIVTRVRPVALRGDLSTKQDVLNEIECKLNVKFPAGTLNRYGNKYGCHTPGKTAEFCEMLKAENIPFEDASWNNDECDRIEVCNLIVSIGKDKNLYPEFSENILMRNDEDNTTITAGTFSEIIEAIKTRVNTSFEINDITVLAREFSKRLAECIGTNKLYLANYLNEHETDKDVCHTHDFCDANVVMLETFEANNIDLAIGEAFYTLAGKVWDCAKLNSFFLERRPNWTPARKLNSTIIQHRFFNDGAIMFESCGEMIFLSPLADGGGVGFNGSFQLWFTGLKVPTDLNKFLTECQHGEHSDAGSGTAGTFAEMLNEISNLK